MKLGIGRQAIGVEVRDGALRAVLCRGGWSGMRTVDALTISQVDTAPASAVAAQFAAWRGGHGANAAWISALLPRDAMICRSIVVPVPEAGELKTVVALQLEYLHPYDDEEILWDCAAVDPAEGSAAPAAKQGQLRKAAARVVVARGSAAREFVDWLRERGISAARLTAGIQVAREIALPETLAAGQGILLLSDGTHLEALAARGGQSVALVLDLQSAPADAAARIAQAIASLPAGTGSGASVALGVAGTLLGAGAYWTALKAELEASYQIHELSETALAEAAARESAKQELDAGMNLLPAAERHFAPTANMIPTYALAGLVIVLAALLGLQGTIRDLRLGGRLDAELEALQPQVAALNSQQDQMTEAYRKVVFLKSVRESSRVPLDVMEEVAQRLPSEAWLQQLQMDGRTATLSGSAGSASEVLQAVSGATQLESAQFLSAILRANDGQESFRIGARLRQPLK